MYFVLLFRSVVVCFVPVFRLIVVCSVVLCFVSVFHPIVVCSVSILESDLGVDFLAYSLVVC